MSIRTLTIILGSLFILVGLSWCDPQYNNCEGYKMKPISETPSRCINY